MVTYNYDTMDKQYFKLLIKCKELSRKMANSIPLLLFMILKSPLFTLLTVVDYMNCSLLYVLTTYYKMAESEKSVLAMSIVNKEFTVPLFFPTLNIAK